MEQPKKLDQTNPDAAGGMSRRALLAAAVSAPAVAAMSVASPSETSAQVGLGPKAKEALGKLVEKWQGSSNIILPQGLDGRKLTDEDVSRLVELVSRGVPVAHGQRKADCPPYSAFSSGTNCSGEQYWVGVGASFWCRGSAGDDFECVNIFQCADFDCTYSFDATDCEQVFSCLDNFSAEGWTGPKCTSTVECTGTSNYTGHLQQRHDDLVSAPDAQASRTMIS